MKVVSDTPLMKDELFDELKLSVREGGAILTGKAPPTRTFLPEEFRMRYKVALRRTEEGYSVAVPGLPGCWSQGATEEEALKNIEDAIHEYLAVVAEQLEDVDVREVEVAV